MTSTTRPPVRRFALLVASLASTAAVLASGAQPASGAAPKPAPTNATITWDSQDIKVKVTSPKATCKANRRTFIMYRTASQVSAAQGRTTNSGVFTFSEAGTPWADGNLLAYVGKMRKACRPGQSNVLPVEGQEVPIRADERARTYAKLTFDGSTLKVKVTSPKASCAKGRRVDVFFYQGNDPFAYAFTGKTNDNGVLTVSPGADRAGAPVPKMVAFTRKSPACAVGQSNTVGVPLA